ncbi:hypothetical protein SUGI_0850140 [Cryptomeria japonica]|uniref:glutaredoxin-C5-like n=1 Tax=Cryptomeria japonica TaxID=3369 RepID=UPI0024149634|nr:glutaredoxin-C5-like [Cryptomeria japonica]GLJ41065.1 hypothetical protein SUGI_0850140 [Cryptomeria japonica]
MQGLQYRWGAAETKCWVVLQLRNLAKRFESSAKVVEQLVAENAVLIFSVTSCCMCDVIKRLLCSLGVNSVVCELNEVEEGLSGDICWALASMVGCGGGGEKMLVVAVALPIVFVGRKFLGGLDRHMVVHISRELVPRLKETGALCL